MTTPASTDPRVHAPAPGFADPVHVAQQTFRTLLDALARPTTTVPLPVAVTAPGALTDGAAAVLLTLADESTPLWLDPTLADEDDLVEWLAFHTGARPVDDPALAAFAVVATPAALPPLASFAPGTDEAPHTSTTAIVATGRAVVGTTRTGRTFDADGPGFPAPATWSAPDLPADFADQWAANGAVFPRGVDLVFAGDDALVGLPRTARLSEVD